MQTSKPYDWMNEPRWLVRCRLGWVKDWDENDSVILTDVRDDAFEFSGIHGQQIAEHEAATYGGSAVRA